MIARRRFNWVVTLASPAGNVEHKISNFWDPAQEATEDAIMGAARAEAFWLANKRTEYIPISARLVS